LETAEEILNEAWRRARLIGPPEEVLAQSLHVHYVHACIATEIGYFDDAREHFEKAYQCFKDMDRRGLKMFLPPGRDEGAVGGIANALHGLRKYEEAEPMYRKALELADPDDQFSVYIINHGRCLWSLGRYPEASQELEDYLKRRTTTYGPDDVKDFS
jgi:tetratricopeptide (TPR) repeat protein